MSPFQQDKNSEKSQILTQSFYSLQATVVLKVILLANESSPLPKAGFLKLHKNSSFDSYNF